MNKRPAFCVALLAASAALATIATVAADAPRARDFDFTYTAHVTELPADAHRVDVWLPYPVSDANQDVTVTEVTAPFKHEVVKESRFGNSILHLSATDPKVPGFDVEMKIHVRRKEYLHNAFASLKTDAKATRPEAVAMWLKPDRLVPNDDSIRDLAREVTKDKQGDLAKARAIYDYVVDTMAYDKSGTGWGNGDIKWACDAKRGNCTDFHALFIGLTARWESRPSSPSVSPCRRSMEAARSPAITAGRSSTWTATAGCRSTPRRRASIRRSGPTSSAPTTRTGCSSRWGATSSSVPSRPAIP
jgi:hypothetical protein